ncbi:MAG: zf-HC2 domain-containing protein [Lachnospiraceae bacterium]|nr:zf-HC2 domain-containing protein [Lachnospiraceae bacterium]
MKQVHCNVIKDLLPSYLENICSEETSILVKEHLQECDSCKKIMTLMSETDFTSEKTEMQTIDYMKKVNRHFMRKDLLLFGLLVLFLMIGMAATINNIHQNTSISPWTYLVAMPILLLAMHGTLSGFMSKRGKTKRQILSGGGGVIGILYSITLSFACIVWVQTGKFPIEASKMGPFVSNQFLMIAVFEFVLFLFTCGISLRKKELCGIPMTIQLTGCFLSLSLICILHRLDAFEMVIHSFSRVNILFILEGGIMAIILNLLEKSGRTY